MPKLTLEILLKRESNGVLLDIWCELSSGIVPATGHAHRYCRAVNRMIDSGDMCINPTSFRKVYLPSLSKAIYKEMSDRFAQAMKEGCITYDTLALKEGRGAYDTQESDFEM